MIPLAQSVFCPVPAEYNFSNKFNEGCPKMGCPSFAFLCISFYTAGGDPLPY